MSAVTVLFVMLAAFCGGLCIYGIAVAVRRGRHGRGELHTPLSER